MASPIQVKLNLDNASATKVAAAQTIGGAGNLVLTAVAGSGIDSSGAARYLLITTTENDNGINYTITGTDADGNSITEGPTALPNNTTALTAKAYATVITFAVSGAIASNISVGTGNSTKCAISPTIPVDFYNRIAAMISLEITGTETVSILETFDRILRDGTANAIWQAAPSGLTSQSSTTHAQGEVGVTGYQISIASYTNGAKLTTNIIQPLNYR